LGSIRERFPAKPPRDVDVFDIATQKTFAFFLTFGRGIFFSFFAEKIVRWKKNAPPLMNLPSR
jgi:hypothetical protein